MLKVNLHFLLASVKAALAEEVKRCNYDKDDVIIEEGSPDRGLHIVHSGTVRVERSYHGHTDD